MSVLLFPDNITSLLAARPHVHLPQLALSPEPSSAAAAVPLSECTPTTLALSTRSSTIGRALSLGDPQYTLQKPPKATSDCWNRFGVVFIDGAKATVNTASGNYYFVACNTCFQVFTMTPTFGTSSLNRHKCPAPTTQTSILDHAMTPTANATVKKTAKLACVKLCSEDLRAFKITRGSGFIHFTQTMLDIGYKSKTRLVAKDVLPDPTTIQRTLAAEAKNSRALLKARLLAHVARKLWVGATVDMWTEPMSNTSFMSLTCSFITDDWQLVDQVLGVRKLANESHTAVFIKNSTSDLLREFGLNDAALVEFVTDCGSNLTGAEGIASLYKRLPCLCHRLCTVLSTVLTKKTTANNPQAHYAYHADMPGVFDLIDACKALVTYAKRTKIQAHLDTTLKQENTTRWNSLLRMLESIQANIKQVSDLCREQSKSPRADAIDKQLLEDVIDFLAPFNAATLALQASKSPTLQVALHWDSALRMHCLPDAKDCRDIAALRNAVGNILEKKVILDDLHLAAAFLDPRQLGSLKMKNYITKDKEARAIEQIKRIAMGKPECTSPAPTNADAPIPGQRGPDEPSKTKDRCAKRKLFTVDWCDDEAPGHTSKSSVEIEVERYLTLKVSVEERSSYSVLEWWKKQTSMPMLQFVVRCLFAVPASSAKSESNFSDAGNTITKLRNRLKPSVTDDILFHRSFSKNEKLLK